MMVPLSKEKVLAVIVITLARDVVTTMTVTQHDWLCEKRTVWAAVTMNANGTPLPPLIQLGPPVPAQLLNQ
eukprot:2484895-Amphidinium_carterae.1